MPSPINGTATAQAANPTRIINLNAAIPSAINDSAVFAIDQPNETYKISFADFKTFLDLSSYLPLAGGTMTGDITLSNSLSVNDIAEKSNSANIGRIDSVGLITDILSSGSGFQKIVDGTTVGLPSSLPFYLYINQRSATSVSFLAIQDAPNEHLVFTGIQRTGEALVWVQLASDSDLSGYLPLTGGKLTGNGGVLQIQELTATTGVYLDFLYSTGVAAGGIGLGDDSNIKVGSVANDVDIEALSGEIRLRGAQGIFLNNYMFGGNDDFRILPVTNNTQSFLGDSSHFWAALYANAINCVDKLVVTSSDLTNNGEVTAFRGESNETTLSTRGAKNTSGSGAGLRWWKCGDTNKTDIWNDGVVNLAANSSVSVTLPETLTAPTVSTTIQDEGSPAGHTDAWPIQASVSGNQVTFWNVDGSSIRFHWKVTGFGA